VSVLDQIVARTRERLQDLPADVNLLRQQAAEVRASRTPFAFRRAIANEGSSIIAEIKAASPSAGTIVPNPDVEGIAREYARGGASAISVVVERDFFHGSPDWLARASGASGLPVIMKDFVVEPSQIMRGIAAGADAILLLASLLPGRRIFEFLDLLEAYGCDALVEVHDEEELARAVEGGARIIGVNNRDLRDFQVDLATSERLSPLMPDGVLRVAESGIRTRADVERLHAARFDGFLVGESLLRQDDRAQAVRALLGRVETPTEVSR
jgi:indole-3-glycerol phosphate synthase